VAQPTLNISYTPAAPLGDLIDRIWMFGDAPPHTHERILPEGTLELVINLREDEIRIHDPVLLDRHARYSGAVVSGAFRRFFVIDTREHASVMGVHFKPGGASPFLRVPAHELADSHVDLRNLWGPRATELRERLCDAAAPREKFRILEAALLGRLARPLERRSVRDAATSLARGARVKHVVERMGVSHRHFIRVFAAEVGITPKLFGRVVRFQQALTRARSAVAPHWAEIALACGYSDQSHLVNDFVSFSGITPAEYLRHRSERVKDAHVPLPGEGSISSKT
jgi:AraC-like DNA-binding protein